MQFEKSPYLIPRYALIILLLMLVAVLISYQFSKRSAPKAPPKINQQQQTAPEQKLPPIHTHGRHSFIALITDGKLHHFSRDKILAILAEFENSNHVKIVSWHPEIAYTIVGEECWSCLWLVHDELPKMAAAQ